MRRLVMVLCALLAIGSFAYLGFYNYQAENSTKQVDNLSKIKKEKKLNLKKATVTLDNIETPDILKDYEDVYQLNQRLVGWIKIDGTSVDYPVLQTENNDYYLNHNFDQQEDNNGSIFLDSQCSIWPRSQNLILYGHNMKSGKMFGSLKKYKSEDFYKKHSTFQFDTIYEKGTYVIVCVFNEVIHDETEVAFRYYQFINANSAEEFNSYINEMKAMSMYETGNNAEFGDSLLTLSTCDYTKNSDRFVVVAKKIL